MKKLTQDEKEQLQELLLSDGWNALLRALDLLVEDKEEKVVKFHLDGGVERLVQLKLRAEGARELRSDVGQFKEIYLRREEGAKR